jgi:hypothetical protein
MSCLVLRRCGLALLVTCVACNTNPARPDTRGGIEGVIVDCPTPVSGALICTARVTCALYPCPGLPNDVTTLATWTSDDPGVVALTTAGTFQRIGIGNTTIRADWHFDEASRAVSLFANTPPLPTFEIAGNVYRSGMTPSAGAISGAVVSVLDGLVAGRQAISGVAPSPMPGFLSNATSLPQYYRLLGIPSGVYRLRVVKDGYISQERTVTDGTIADFALDPSSP